MIPPIYSAVRAVGVLKPKFQQVPGAQVFADSLDVRGTAFWLKNEKLLVTCAHVVQELLGAPLEVSGPFGSRQSRKLPTSNYRHCRLRPRPCRFELDSGTTVD